MAMKVLILSVFLVACNAGPVWIDDGDDYFPGVILRVGRSPNLAHTNAVPVIYSAPLGYQHASAAANNYGYGRNSAASQAQNFGDYSSAASSAQNLNGYRSAGLPHYQTAAASAKTTGGLGYLVRDGLGYNAAASSAQNGNGFEYNAATSAAENVGGYGYGGSRSQATQQRAGVVQNSGASSINLPGHQTAQSHAVSANLF